MKRLLLLIGLLIGAALAVPSVELKAQPVPTSTPGPGGATTPVVTSGVPGIAPEATSSAQRGPTATPGFQPAGGITAQPVATAPFRPVATTTTSSAPRAGGFPLELAFPLLAGGGAAMGAGAYLLRRGRRP